MLQIVLLAGKFVFLIVLYLFVYQVIRSTTRELRTAAPSTARQSWSKPISLEGTGTAQALSRGEGGVTWALVVLKSPHLRVGEEFAFPPGASAVVGRASDMDIYLEDTFVSSKHALLEAAAGVLRVEDLHSTNGTIVNGQEISGIQELHPDDRVEVGDTVFRVEVRG